MVSGGALAGAAAGAAVVALSSLTRAISKKGQRLTPDVEFLLSRAAALQGEPAAGGATISLDSLLSAMHETGAAAKLGPSAHGGGAHGTHPPAANGGVTKKELEETMQKMLAPPGGLDPNESALDRFTLNLTDQARCGKLDPVIGREEEIRRCVHILSRRTKNNPVLVGESGVGKTAIVEGLAQRIVSGDVPMNLLGVRILELDLGALTAGCMMPGEFEERLKAVLNEMAVQGSRAILFIDDIHNLVPAIGSAGSTMMDGGALLKPALSRGELRCIGASTTDKFKKTIEKDAALERRFQQVFVDQPTVPQTITILRGLRQRYEGYHDVGISEGALVAAASLSARYINGRFLPDKAIDLIDEATAQVKMELTLKPEALDVAERKISQLQMEIRSLEKKAANDKTAATCLAELELQLHEAQEVMAALAASHAEAQGKKGGKNQVAQMMKLSGEVERLEAEACDADNDGDVEQACSLRSRKTVVEQELAEVRNAAVASVINGHAGPGAAFGAVIQKTEVMESDVAKVISRWTGIPVTKLVASEKEKLLHLTDELHKRIIGQEEAVDAVAEAIQRSRADLADPNGPIASFMFLGPTGVGKTELAKALAAYMFNSDDAMVRLDMSEYMEKHAVSRLIGAPPGYVGYDEGGLLTDSVRRRPYAVVLFDEIEKAHVDVFNILLQILDDGRVTDTQGRVVSFKNTIIIMTSNLGSAEIFAEAAKDKDRSTVKDKVMEHVRSHFRPEFINRVDDFITFEPLQEQQIKQIVVLRAQRLVERMAEKRMVLELKPGAVDWLAQVGYDPLYGARPVKRALQRELQTLLAKALLRGDFVEDDTVLVDAQTGDGCLTLVKGPKVETAASRRVAQVMEAAAAKQKVLQEAEEERRRKISEFWAGPHMGNGLVNGNRVDGDDEDDAEGAGYGPDDDGEDDM